MPTWVTPPPPLRSDEVEWLSDQKSLGSRDRLILIVLCTVVFLLCALRGATHPFWFDEIATAHIAGSSTWQQMLHRSQIVDLHPPLEFSLVRISFLLFGPHEFAGHLPSVIAFTVTVGALFVFLRRRVSATFALFGALLPLANPEVFSYVTEARSYGLLLGAVCLGVLGYDTILREQHPIAARLVLALSIVAILQAHLFGTFAAAAFILAETVRSLRQRRVDSLTWLALFLPWLSCITYVPLLRSQALGQGSPLVYEVKNQNSLIKGLLFYHQTIYLPLSPLIKFTAVVLLCVRYFPPRRFGRALALTPELTTLLLVLLATPILVTVLLNIRAPGSGFFPRYAIAAVCPAYLLLSCLVAWRGGDLPYVSLLFTAGALVFCAMTLAEVPQAIRTVARNGLLSAPPGLDQTNGVERICPDLPLALNDGLQFLEADFRLNPTTETRMVYVTDPAESLRLEHENATEAVAGMSRAFQTPHHVIEAAPFLAEHPHFVLLVRPRHTGWLFDALREKHAQMELLGTYTFAGTNDEAWLVTQQHAGPFAATANCPAH